MSAPSDFASYPRNIGPQRRLNENSGAVPYEVINYQSTTLSGATPTPTVAQLLGGQIKCSNNGAYTLTQTNLTGAALDAAIPAFALRVGLTLPVVIVSTNAAGVPTIGAAAAGVTQYGVLVGATASCVRINYVRTGAATWDSIVFASA
jgi:translation initiation factor 6 (eIF-6)